MNKLNFWQWSLKTVIDFHYKAKRLALFILSGLLFTGCNKDVGEYVRGNGYGSRADTVQQPSQSPLEKNYNSTIGVSSGKTAIVADGIKINISTQKKLKHLTADNMMVSLSLNRKMTQLQK
jgi:hypothetical protein